MSNSINVLIVGHSTTGLNYLEQSLHEDPEIHISRKLLRETTVDPFDELPVEASVIVLDLGDNWRDVLDSVASRSRRNRTPMILVGPDDNTEMMRLAMRAGARDFQSKPVDTNDFLNTVHRLANEEISGNSDAPSALPTIFVSAKGGAGSTALVSSLGHALAKRRENTRTLLVDLDLQYGNLPVYFDESSTTRLTQALVANERMDPTLLDACVIKTDYGIDLLASYSDQVFSAWEAPLSSVSNLLNLVCDRYDYILVDIPRQIDPITFSAIELADKVCIVMQQNLSDLRYARQIVALLRDQGLSNDKLRLLVNRHDKKNVLRTRDIEDAFDGIPVSILPNDFKRMSYATGNAIPLIKKYKNSQISKSITTLADTLLPSKEEQARGNTRRKRVKLFGRR